MFKNKNKLEAKLGLFYGAFIVSCFAAAMHDFLFYRIPNAIVVFLIGLFLAKVVFFQSFSDMYIPLLVLILSVAAGFALYAFRIIGAGDAKFLAATSMWASEVNLLSFLFVTSVAGGILGLIYVMQGDRLEAARIKMKTSLSNSMGEATFNKVFGLDWLPKMSNENTTQAVDTKKVIPYGVAIFMGCIILMLL